MLIHPQWLNIIYTLRQLYYDENSLRHTTKTLDEVHRTDFSACIAAHNKAVKFHAETKAKLAELLTRSLYSTPS